MPQSKPCHFLLTISSESQAITAEELASRMFKRVLANWAQDLLVQLQKNNEIAILRNAA
jgi:hypothetical protein